MATQTTAEQHDVDTHGNGHGSHDGHHERLQHHFQSMDQQFSSAKLGMWLFLLTELLLFSGMFVAYAVYFQWYPETFAITSEALDWRMGFANTIVLLASSLTVALSIHFIQKGNVKAMITSLGATLALSAVFLIIKYFEYTDKFANGIYPGEAFNPTGAYAYLDVPNAVQYFSIYYVMTGIHAVHVVIGMVIFAWLIYRGLRQHFSPEWYTPVELGGLYWHFVDLVWIFLFPLLYLI